MMAVVKQISLFQKEEVGILCRLTLLERKLWMERNIHDLKQG